MPVPRRRHCSARRKRGRTHKQLTPVSGIDKCLKCGEPRLPHRVCPSCGDYKGRFYGKVDAVK
ncbi:MAG: 50S ribosomal protein L32 [bacterium]|nr:50S ribosomal protein L32 [Candidatus Sumerlaeota bacterium]